MIHPLADVQSENIGEGTQIWQFVIILKGSRIGNNCNINCHNFIENEVVIGDNVTIKPGVYLWDGIELEDDVMIGPNVTFTNDRNPRSKNSLFKLEKTIVKKGSSLGAGSVILCGIEIGEWSMVGAGAVVTKSVPSRALVIGNPARVVAYLNKDGSKMVIKDDFYLDNEGRKWKLSKEGLELQN